MQRRIPSPEVPQFQFLEHRHDLVPVRAFFERAHRDHEYGEVRVIPQIRGSAFVAEDQVRLVCHCPRTLRPTPILLP